MSEAIKRIAVPSLGLSVEEVTVVDWLIGEGDQFEEGQQICEVETEKTATAVEAPFAGTLRKILAQAGDTLPVQAVMAVAADASVSDQAISEFLSGSVEPATELSEAPVTSAGLPETSARTTDAAATVDEDDSGVHATPRARKLAAAQGLNLHNVPGTGRNNRISRRDVERALGITGKKPVRQTTPVKRPREVAPISQSGSEPLSSIRRVIAERLQASKQTIPHYRLVIDVDVTALLEERRQLNRQLRRQKASINDFLIKACAQALMEVPAVNIQFDGTNIQSCTDADIAIAVALDDGLITPIVRAAQDKSITEISVEMLDLAARAKSGKLLPDEYQGGSFCISNLGMYGIRQFDAIINPPQGSILAVGASRDSVVVQDGQVQVSKVSTLTLSSDHRVIDGASGARFLAALRKYVETPKELLQ